MKAVDIIEKISKELPVDVLSVEISMKGRHGLDLKDYSFDIFVIYKDCENTLLSCDPTNLNIETVIEELKKQIEEKDTEDISTISV